MTFTVKVPGVAVAEAASVNVDAALPPEAGVTLAGAKDDVTPLGTPEMLRLVGLLKPLRLPTVTVVAVLPPWFRLTDAGDTPTLKSAGGAAPKTSVTFAV